MTFIYSVHSSHTVVILPDTGSKRCHTWGKCVTFDGLHILAYRRTNSLNVNHSGVSPKMGCWDYITKNYVGQLTSHISSMFTDPSRKNSTFCSWSSAIATASSYTRRFSALMFSKYSSYVCSSNSVDISRV